MVCTHKIVPGLGHDHSTGGKLPGKIWNHHQRDMQGSCNLSCMEPTGPAETDYDEIARVVAAFDGNLTHGERHVHDRNFDDRSRSFGFGKSKWTRNMPVDGIARRFHVQQYFPTQKLVWIKPTQQKVGICDCRLRSTLPIAGRARISGSACRTNPE